MNSPVTLPPHDEYLLDKILLEITALRWPQALDLLSQMSVQDAAAKQMQRLAANMKAAQQHRVILYNQLCVCIEQGKLNLHFRPAVGGHGEWETVARDTDGGEVLDHPSHSPTTAAKQHLAVIQPGIAKDGAVAVIGIRDGFVLSALAKAKPPFGDGRATPVFAIEPDPERVLAVLQIHDWSSNRSPLTKPAFEWIVGKDWGFELRNRLQQDPMLPVPTLCIAHPKEKEAELLSVAKEVIAYHRTVSKDRFQDFKGRKELCSKRPVAKLLVENPKRLPTTPKAAVIGSRFHRGSMKLAPEIARGLASMGWKIAAVIENNERQRMTPQNIQDRIAAFDPNLIVCVHQPMTDLPGTLEPNTPTLHFGAVPAGVTGQESSVRATFAEPLSLAHLAVGDRGLVSPGLMPEINLPAPTARKAPRVVIMGDAPEPPLAILKGIIEACSSRAAVLVLVERIGHAMVDHYGKGHSLSTLGQLESLVARDAGDSSPAAQREALELLWPLNAALHMLHTAQMAAKACKACGGELRLVGAGWEAHPALATFRVDPDKALKGRQAIIRGATVCLTTHPGFCLNADFLNLVAEGAFVMVRDHPLNQDLPNLAAFLAKNAPNVRDEKEAAALSPELRKTFQALADKVRKCLPKFAPDPVVMVRSCARGGTLDNQMQALPHLAETSFSNADQLAELITQWHADPEKRTNVVRAQQEALHGRLATEPTLLRAIYLLARRFVVNA